APISGAGIGWQALRLTTEKVPYATGGVISSHPHRMVLARLHINFLLALRGSLLAIQVDRFHLLQRLRNRRLYCYIRGH
ncbi:hypothetical protein ABTD83_20670, partial [Acinetobacter baumannii]